MQIQHTIDNHLLYQSIYIYIYIQFHPIANEFHIPKL